MPSLNAQKLTLTKSKIKQWSREAIANPWLRQYILIGYAAKLGFQPVVSQRMKSMLSGLFPYTTLITENQSR